MSPVLRVRPSRAPTGPTGSRDYTTILYYTILYYTILYYTILYYTILYYTMIYLNATCNRDYRQSYIQTYGWWNIFCNPQRIRQQRHRDSRGYRGLYVIFGFLTPLEHVLFKSCNIYSFHRMSAQLLKRLHDAAMWSWFNFVSE